MQQSPFTRSIQCTLADQTVRDIIVTIGLPEPDSLPGGDFRVLLRVTGLEEPYSHYVHGADALHAFLECCWLVSEILPSLAPKGSRLTWLGNDDLGFWRRPSMPVGESAILRDREVANALSEGLNTVVAIDQACRAGAAPQPDWAPALKEVGGALEAVKSGDVHGSMSVQEHHLASLQKLRAVVEQWSSGIAPSAPEVRGLVTEIIGAFGEPSQILSGVPGSP